LFRHFLDDGIDPFEIRHRVGRVSVDLEVLDLTDPTTRAHLGVTEAHLTAEDLDVTQEIAGAARDAGFDAILAPAVALPGCQTLAVFAHALAKVTAQRSVVQQPPPRLADLLPVIRPHEAVPDTVRRMLVSCNVRGQKRSDADATSPAPAAGFIRWPKHLATGMARARR